MRTTTRWLAAGLLLLLGGCVVNQGPGFGGWKEPDPGVGLVYLYRPWSFVGGLLPVRVYVDGERKADLDNGTHQVYELSPGKHTVLTEMGSLPITTEKITIEVDVRARSVLYARFKAHRKDVGGGTAVRLIELTMVNEDTARREIPDTKRSE